jgi:integrase
MAKLVTEVDGGRHVLASKREQSGRPLSAGTVRLCDTVVRQALDQARKWGFVAFNVATDATLPRGRKREIKPPSVDVLRDLLDAAAADDAEFGLYLRVMVATGCRRGDAVALRWTASIPVEAS